MILFVLLILVTLLVVAGYFIQFSAQHAEGSLKTFGKYLSLWVFVLAGLLVVGAAVQPAIGYGGFGPGAGIARAFGPGARLRFERGREFGFARRRGLGFGAGTSGGAAAPPTTPQEQNPPPAPAP